MRSGSLLPNVELVSAAATLLLLGAMSPGPSFAVVARNSIAGGRETGVLCAVGHGLGFGGYALAVVLGFAALLNSFPTVITVLQAVGAVVLFYLAYESFAGARTTAAPDVVAARPARGFAEGLAIAVFNPKIALFFIAVLSAVLSENMNRATQVWIALAGWIIDTAWYVVVALALSSGPAASRLRALGPWIDYTMAILLGLLGLATLARVFSA